MPFYSKQALLRDYNRWNAPKRRHVDRYIEVIYGKTFLTELKMNHGKKRQELSSAIQGRSQQPKQADLESPKQKPSDSEARDAGKDEGHLQQETIAKETQRGKHCTQPALGRKSREEGSCSGLMTLKSRQSAKRAAQGVRGEAFKKEEKEGSFQGAGEKESVSDQDTFGDREEGEYILTRSESSKSEHTGEALKKRKVGRLQADARCKADSTIQDDPDPDKGSFISTRTRHFRGILKKNVEGNRDKGTTGGSLRAPSAQRSEDVPGGHAEMANSDPPESSRVVEDKPSAEQQANTFAKPSTSSLKRDSSANVGGAKLDFPVREVDFDLQKIQALNVDVESTVGPASVQDDEDSGPSETLAISRGRPRERRAFSLGKRRRVTRQRFTSFGRVSGNYKVDSKDSVINSALTPQPSSTSDSEVKESVSDSAEGSSAVLMQESHSPERKVAPIRAIRFRQTARKCFPKPRPRAPDGDKSSHLTKAKPFSSAPATKSRLGTAPFSHHATLKIHRLPEPIDYSPSSQTTQGVSFAKVGSQDETQFEDKKREAVVDAGEKAKRVRDDASSDDISPRAKDSCDEDLWNLSVVSPIEDIPLLEDDDKRESPQRETDGSRYLRGTQQDVIPRTQDWTSGGIPSQHKKPESDIDESVIDESVEDDSPSPISYLPGLSHLHDNLATEKQLPYANSPIIPVLGVLRQPTKKDKQAQINQTAPTTRSRSCDGQRFTSPTNLPAGNTKPKTTAQEAEQTEKVSPREKQSLTDKPVAMAPKLTDPGIRSLTVRTPAEKKQRWFSQAGITNSDQRKHGLEQEDQHLFSPVAVTEVDLAGDPNGNRKRKRSYSQEGQMRGNSGWEESLRQKLSTVTRFQAGEMPRPSKKAEAEKKRWQSPPKTLKTTAHQSPRKANGDKPHLVPKSPFRDVWKPPPSKKMKLLEDTDAAHKLSEEEGPSTPITAHVSTPRPPPVLQDKFRYGEIIWGKMKGFNWWPGRVVHHHTCGQDAAHSDACWVKWFGDDKFSKLNLNQVTPFVEFSAYFSQSTFLHTALYRRAVFHAMLLASTRAGKTYSSDPTQYKTEIPKRSKRSDPAWQKFYELCIDMIKWAKEGFEPGGKDAIMPDEEEQQLPPRPPSPPPSPLLSTPTKRTNRSPSKSSGTWKDIRDVVIPEVRSGIKFMEDICIGCGSSEVRTQHPFFIGGLCEVCRIEFVEMAYLFDEDGYQCFCCICAEGSDVVLCDHPECYRSFCHDCMEYLVGPGEVQTVLANDQWRCYMCDPEPTAGMLTRRKDWPQKLLLFFQQDKSQNFPPMRTYPPVEMDQRKPIRVLSLFDGIGTGMLVLKELGVKVDCYFASEISEEAMQVSSVRHDGVIQQLSDIRHITEKEIQSLGPFDLLIGGSPCNDLSIANPVRKGLFEGTGKLFFEFYRLLNAVRPEADSQRPFFWLFENVVGMAHNYKMDISRFLQCDPVVVDAKDVSPAHRARYFWGNLPGMNRPNVATDHNALCLQDCLEPNCNRQAQFSKVRTVTSKLNSIKQKNESVLPVLMNGQEDALWCTEMERIFGFPEHYTDIANMSRSSRHKLIGQAWSVPVIKHLLAPLKEYFACETHE